LYYLPIVTAAVSLGVRAAIGVSLAAGLVHLVAGVFGCGDSWPRAVADTVLYVVVGVMVAKLSTLHASLPSAGQPLAAGPAGLAMESAYRGVQSPSELSALNQLATGLIHRFRTPVSSIEGAVWLLEDGRYPEEKREEFVRIIQKESHQLERALADMMEFTQPRRPRWHKADVSALLDQVIVQAGPKEHGPYFLFLKEGETDLPPLVCDPDLVCKMILNIVMNSVQATPGGGQIEIKAHREGGDIVFTITDHGRGISPDVVERIFEPFFTTRESGLGLGLTVARQIATQHCGTIAVIETSKNGTRIQVRLPQSAPERDESRKHIGG
jgi:signal transduction histidine kinase